MLQISANANAEKIDDLARHFNITSSFSVDFGHGEDWAMLVKDTEENRSILQQWNVKYTKELI